MKDTEEKATERYMRGGFGRLGSKSAYKRYSKHIDLLKAKKGLVKTDPREWVGYVFVPKYIQTQTPETTVEGE